MKKIFLLILLIQLSILDCELKSQSLSVFDLEVSNFPTVKAKFFAFDASGNQITNLSPSDFEVKENGQPRSVTYVSCPSPKPPQALSSVLTIDVSGSMLGSRLKIVKDAAVIWVNSLSLGQSECAITSFDDRNYLNQDFTTNRDKLLNAINNLKAMGGTDYNEGLIRKPAGSLVIANNGKHKRVIVFLTDGLTSYPTQTESIISEARNQNCVIYSVVVGIHCPQELKDISDGTGGLWYENINTYEETNRVYREILKASQGNKSCDIEWQSGVSCTAGITNVELTFQTNGAKATTSYQKPLSAVAKFEFEPKYIKFQDPIPGVKIEKNITITVINADINVSNIRCNVPAYSITPSNFFLKSGQGKELLVSYTPSDSNNASVRFDIDNDVCPVSFYATTGWFDGRPKIRTLKLLQPNGGEVFVAGSDVVITWEGIAPDEPVKIEYSIDNGGNWITIADSAKDLSYDWIAPKTPSEQCLARVTALSSESFYDEVEICGKTWMKENLDVVTYRNGDPIPHVSNPTEWANLTTGAWCYYNNDPANDKIYGKLYNWYAINDPRGLAPVGWRVATDDDWTELTNCLGGSSVAGGKLKSTGTIEGGDGLWGSPNTGATNLSGFSAFPGGYFGFTGTFFSIGRYGYWWASGGFIRILGCDSENIYRQSIAKASGLSVRCVRD